jgi:uncharacterized membrane protein
MPWGGGSGALGEVLQATIWWAHTMATVAWIGGALFYLIVLRPATRAAGSVPELERAVSTRFRDVVEVSAVVLVVSGVILSAQRLSSGAADGRYAAVLALKVSLGLAMCALAWELRWPGRSRRPAAAGRRRLDRAALSRLTLVLGIMVILLAVVLRRLYEAGLGG